MEKQTENKELEKKEGNKSIKLYWKGNVAKIDINGQSYWTPYMYLYSFMNKKRKYCYLTRWYSDEERKAFLEKREAEFKEKVKLSLRSEKPIT